MPMTELSHWVVNGQQSAVSSFLTCVREMIVGCVVIDVNPEKDDCGGTLMTDDC